MTNTHPDHYDVIRHRLACASLEQRSVLLVEQSANGRYTYASAGGDPVDLLAGAQELVERYVRPLGATPR